MNLTITDDIIEKTLEEGGPLPRTDRWLDQGYPKPDDKIRLGGYASIRVPSRVVRCGYPLHKQAVIKQIWEKHETEICDLLNRINKTGKSIIANSYSPHKVHGLMDILNGLAYNYMKTNKFGGVERKLYEEPIDIGYIATIGRVTDRRIVVSGTYYPPGGCYDDYEPGGLDNRKPHHIAWFEGIPNDPLRSPALEPFTGWVKITNLNRVHIDDPKITGNWPEWDGNMVSSEYSILETALTCYDSYDGLSYAEEIT